YSVNITDSNGCTVIGSTTITEPDAITLNILKKDNLCFGDRAVLASVKVKGGTAPYKYKWSYRDTTSSAINNLAAGNYYITVNDNNNCTKNDSIIIKQPSAGLSLSFRHSNITCYGLSTGSINTNVAGGTSPYIYNWSTGSSEQNIKDLKKGIYKLTVTDFNKCTISGLDSIVEPDSLKLAYNKIDNICNNDKRGTINVNVSGGTSPYYYTWNTNPVTNASSITMLAAGKYTISVSDANKCKTSQTINISEPKPFNIIHSEKNISCNGLCNGSISVIVTGNTSPYSYSWNTKKSQNSPDIENVCAGKYRVTISDTNNCTTLDSITISAPPILNSFLRDTIDVYCNGLCTGQAGIGVSGGDQPYTYSWNTGLNTATITNLCPGTYSVTVKDNNGCQSVSGYNVKIKSSLSLNVDSIVNPTCEGAKNGTVKITVTNGKEPYIYSWSSGQKTSVITGLSAGKYNVTITDGYGCNKQTMINLSEPSKLLLKTDSLKKPSCSISCNGFTEVSASGGTPPYQYSWNTGLNTYQISQLCEGKYSVTVIDANNCVANIETDIISPKEIKSILTPTGTLCANICNGGINMNVAGGTPPYTYKWNNNQINKNNYGLCAGKYIVTITDANGCSRIDSGTIKSLNSSPDFRIVSDNNNVQPGQQVNLTVISGVNNLNYQWVYADDLNSTNPTHAIANPIKSKMYYLKATDKNNCARLDSIFINVIEKNECNESNVFIPNAFTPNEDNVNEKIFVRGRNIKEIYFAIFDRWGEKMFETRNQNEGWDGKYKGMDCKPAVFVYYLEVTCPGDEKFFKKGNITLIR
ncbi:MAG: gliding motility-associated C-terminal domain-containing protein, partial [Bacteroidota bacterium]|nr:gliding motility-associated C-terminal domain-containing protein [Bacteroidota bacterium]